MKRILGILAVASAIAVTGLVAPPSAPAAGVERAEYIVTLRAAAGDPRPAAAMLARKTQGTVTHVYRHTVHGFSVSLPLARVEVLAADPTVESIERSVEFTRAFDPYTEQRATSPIDRIDGDLSSARSGDGSGTVDIGVAVIDDGVDINHPDLNVVGGVSCVGMDAVHPDPVSQIHGTMVAGFVAARDNAIGIVGSAPGARIFAVQVFKGSTGTTADIVCGIDAVTATRTDADPTNDVKVANMSLAGAGQDDGKCLDSRRAMHRAICASENAGVTYVVAASNESQDFAKREPATYDDVLTVTAMSETDGIPGGLGPAPGCEPETGAKRNTRYRDDLAADFSDYAAAPSDYGHVVAAPGVCMTGLRPVGSCADIVPAPNACYGVGTGTSFATPWAAGTVALCIAQGPCAGLAPRAIVTKIVADANTYTAANPDYGFVGDPLRPIPKRYYGPLIRTGAY